jgi:pimeloyl-ACP methyl ester carboxylesterase
VTAPRAAGPEAARYARLAHVRWDATGHATGHATGRGTGGSGPAVLLLHGLGGDSGQLWDYLDAGLARIAPDLRAHGATDYIGPDAAFTFDGLADDVVALLDRLGLTRPVLAAGVSMGTGIALNLAIRWPSRLAALVLIRPAWLDQPLPRNLACYPLIAGLLRARGPRDGLARFERTAGYRAVLAKSPAAAASLRGQFTAGRAAERAVRLDRMPRSVPGPDLSALRHVRLPVLVVGARRDPVHPVAMAETIAAALPDARLRVVMPRDDDAARQLAQISAETSRFLRRAR